MFVARVTKGFLVYMPHLRSENFDCPEFKLSRENGDCLIYRHICFGFYFRKYKSSGWNKERDEW